MIDRFRRHARELPIITWQSFVFLSDIFDDFLLFIPRVLVPE